MRILLAFLCAVLLSAFASAQKRYLVSPNQEVIPIPQGSSAQKLITEYSQRRTPSKLSTDCSSQFWFGYEPTPWPVNNQFGFRQRDVMGEWFIAPARGKIDTIYFEPNGTIGTPDSLVILRIFNSNLSPGHGPGYDYPPPCISWGYWKNTSDPEGGIAAFIEDATDTSWTSTVDSNRSPKPSFAPFGLSVWGMGGVPVKLKPNTVNAVPTDIIPGGFQIRPHSPGAKDTIDIGEAFFFAMEMPSLDSVIIGNEVYTQFSASNTGPFPSRDWKFYEHDSSAANCAGTPLSEVKKGWVARGPFSDDTNATAAFNVWYEMTPSSNFPPKINSIDKLGYTLSTGNRIITMEAFDCDAESPGRAGVESAYVRYRILDLAGVTLLVGTVPMVYIGGDSYSGTLPGVAGERIVSYKAFAYDSTGLADSTIEFSYRVVGFNSLYYKADTTLPCTTMSISGTGAAIDPSEWFLPPRTTNTHPGDDGTAGPFSLGGPFIYFGDTLNYAWVGVNGAIALSKTAAETLDVNANGFPTHAWTLPQRQYHGRSDFAGQDSGLMPKNFIAPFWADWIVGQDAPPAQFGHIRYSSTAFADKFVAEWDSVGDYDAIGAVADNDIFRVVLDRLSGSIQFQYDNVGVGGLDSLNLTGIQSDSLTHAGPITPFNFFNKDGSPPESRIHNGLCLSYYPCAFQLSLTDGWNLISNGVILPGYSKSFLFPTAVSPAFSYNGGYYPRFTLPRVGGYWVKFNGAQTICVPGTPVLCIDDTVEAGWNIIGSVSKPVLVSSIISPPPSIVMSPFFGYSGSYIVASVIFPGHAYWVKVAAAGVLHICASGAVPKEVPAIDELAGLDKLTIQDKLGRAQALYIGSDDVLTSEAASKYEMPPGAPEGELDVRFSSGRMVEVYPSQRDPANRYEYPISIQGAVYPLMVKWETARGSARKLALTAIIRQETKTLAIFGGSGAGSGKVTISDAVVNKLVLKLTEGLALPKEFALSQNYPNPFNPTTHFNVDIPKLSEVFITVYDVLGRKIATLMSGEQEAGYHTVEWDSKDSHGLTVPSGMYVVRMTAGEFTSVRKVLLMR
jgi:flagellar hook capping protein FlgD